MHAGPHAALMLVCLCMCYMLLVGSQRPLASVMCTGFGGPPVLECIKLSAFVPLTALKCCARAHLSIIKGAQRAHAAMNVMAEACKCVHASMTSMTAESDFPDAGSTHVTGWP